MCNEGGFWHPFKGIRNHVTLSGVQITTAGVHPQRPSWSPGGFPCRQRKTVIQKLRESESIQDFRRRWRIRKDIRPEGILTSGWPCGQVFQIHHHRSFIASEGIRLVGPVEPMRTLSIPFVSMFGFFVVCDHGGDGGIRGAHLCLEASGARCRHGPGGKEP